jgi:phosphoenolpyruvate synthase/pyruvate phosphate dikinase
MSRWKWIYTFEDGKAEGQAGMKNLLGGKGANLAEMSDLGQPVVPEIMVPLVMTKAELDLVKERIVAMAEAVAKESGVTVEYQVGTMIELPRAALRAGEIAESAEFFSFGTNDLTQTTLGISRDDAASFLGPYTQKGLLPADPFVTIDQEGVGELVKLASRRGPPSSSAFAASMVAIRPRSTSVNRSGSITCPARRTAYRSHAWPPRRRPSATKLRAKPRCMEPTQ